MSAPSSENQDGGLAAAVRKCVGYSSCSPFYSRWSSNGDEESHFVFKSKNHHTQNGEKLRKFFASGVLCDVVLKCDDLHVPCHRLVLAASSDYFAAMFTGGMAESRQNEVNVNGIDCAALKLLINFCYTGEISLTDSGVENLLSGACLLQLNEVIEACSDYLRHQLHPSNCLGIKNFADAQGCRRLHDSAHTFTTDHFMDVVQQSEFLLLPVDDLLKLLSSDELNVACESVVFKALVTWLDHDPAARRCHVGALLTAVRLPFLSADFIVDNIENNEIFQKDPSCKELITQAYKYHLLPDRRRSVLPEFRPRKSTMGALYVIGGNDSQKGALTIERYDCIKNRWSTVGQISSRRLQFGVAVLENRIFVVGGREGLKALNTFEFWDSDTGSWTQMPAMNTPRHGLGVTVLENVVYAVGGHDGWSYLSSAERWDSNSKTWSYISEMTSPRSGAGVVSLDGKIYIVGGRDGSQCLRSTECYSPHTNKWTSCAAMSKKRGSVGVGVLHNCIYAVGGLESPSCNGTAASARYACVERYDPKMDAWSIVANLSVGRDGVAVATLGDQLYAVGGYSGHHYLSLVECYDSATNEWTKSASLTNGRASACLALVAFRHQQKHASLDPSASSSSLNSIT